MALPSIRDLLVTLYYTMLFINVDQNLVNIVLKQAMHFMKARGRVGMSD